MTGSSISYIVPLKCFLNTTRHLITDLTKAGMMLLQLHYDKKPHATLVRIIFFNIAFVVFAVKVASCCAEVDAVSLLSAAL